MEVVECVLVVGGDRGGLLSFGANELLGVPEEQVVGDHVDGVVGGCVFFGAAFGCGNIGPFGRLGSAGTPSQDRPSDISL